MGAYTDDVLFIHIPKCGGTAVKRYMLDHLRDVRWPRTDTWFWKERGLIERDPTPEDEQAANESVQRSRLPIGHVPLRDIERFTGRPLDSWERIIATIRNPYHQQVSQWLFWRDRYAKGQNHQHDLTAAMYSRVDGWLQDAECDFHLWYEQRVTERVDAAPRKKVERYEDFGGCYLWWLEVDGEIPDNLLILKQERLESLLPAALAPWLDGVPPPMKRVNAGPGGEYMDYITKASSIDTINAKFRWTFGSGFYEMLEVVR